LEAYSSSFVEHAKYWSPGFLKKKVMFTSSAKYTLLVDLQKSCKKEYFGQNTF
jgi:predicted nuclease of restriction endonuclease-like RecB superfamily